MFHLMNFARIGVGIQGLAVASSAYLGAAGALGASSVGSSGGAATSVPSSTSDWRGGSSKPFRFRRNSTI